MNSDQKIEVQQISYQNLTQIQDLPTSGTLIETYIKGHNWYDISYNCITQLRKINKYHSEFIPDIIQRYSQTILDLLNTGKTLIVKNILKFIKQLFDVGQQINVQKAVYAFLPVIIKKASTDIGYMKTAAQQVLTSFSSNCGYQISFVMASQYCCDKNATVAELSAKLLSVLIQKVGSGIMQLNQNTLSCLMKSLCNMIDGKRQTLKNNALDICIFICQSIGSDNYLKLMTFCLKQEEVRLMGTSMQSHRQSKIKPQSLKQAIRSRNTQHFNPQFFNTNDKFYDVKQDQNYYNNENINYSNSQSRNYY